jgi:hypothetical protein
MRKYLFRSDDLLAFTTHENGSNLPELPSPWSRTYASQDFAFLYNWEPDDFRKLQREIRAVGFYPVRMTTDKAPPPLAMGELGRGR